MAMASCGEDFVTSATPTPPPGGATGSCKSGTPTSGPDDFNQKVSMTPRSDGLQTGDIAVGSGQAAKTGDKVSVQYSGWLTNCTLFDSSRKPGRTPFQFTIGQGQVIKGWDEGVPGMKVGGKRRLIIPATLGYGAQGSPPTIPANATLVFDITLVSIS